MREQTNATTVDQRVAWLLCTELSTRITTQALPLLHGDEVTALDSVVDFFRLARKTLAENPGCARCAPVVIDAMNKDIRPFTARWHRLKEQGRLHSMDERYSFRASLEDLQGRLRVLAGRLADVAGMPLAPLGSTSVPDVARLHDVDKTDTTAKRPITFGIQATPAMDGDTIDAMNTLERKAIDLRRSKAGLSASLGQDAVGLAISGGGLRSATFALGVTQVLARRGLLKDVDYLSTVSGGGYLGSFISAHGVEALSPKRADPTSTCSTPGEVAPEPLRVRHLRNHSKYLSEGGLATVGHMAYTLISGLLVSGVSLCATILALLALLALMSHGAWLWHAITIAAAAIAIGTMLLQTTRFGQAHSAKLRLWGAVASVSTIVFTFGGVLLSIGSGVSTLAAELAERTWDATSWLSLAVVAVVVVVAWFSDPNAGSLHAYYRDRLARTFIAQFPEDKAHCEPLLLKDLNAEPSITPYHLINAALNVPGSTHPELRGRRSDFFLFSRHFCGSVLTGWRPSEEVGMDLATAMAISGAAASPNMGSLTRPGPRLLLGVLGLRLGWWQSWPKKGAPKQGSQWPRPTGLICYLRELTGSGMDERQTQLNLSDGGHLENLGVYELLRRRCRYILAIDGECDPNHHFGGLLTLARMAEIDLGVKIPLDLGDLNLNDAGETNSHFIVAPIIYPNEPEAGLLVYCKLSVTGNESEYLHNFRREFPDFPHQSTAQQLFSEMQFEAYRALGEHVGSEMFSSSLLAGASPTRIASWMEVLGARLLPEAQ